MRHLKSVRIGELVAGEQPSASDVLELRKQGFRSIVNLRLPRESSQELTPEQESGLATVFDLRFAHLPISADRLSEEDVLAFREAVAGLPAPVYVHCGLGQRAATLALLADAENNAQASQAIARAERQGIAISPKVRDFIGRHFERQRGQAQGSPTHTLICGTAA